MQQEEKQTNKKVQKEYHLKSQQHIINEINPSTKRENLNNEGGNAAAAWLKQKKQTEKIDFEKIKELVGSRKREYVEPKSKSIEKHYQKTEGQDQMKFICLQEKVTQMNLVKGETLNEDDIQNRTIKQKDSQKEKEKGLQLNNKQIENKGDNNSIGEYQSTLTMEYLPDSGQRADDQINNSYYFSKKNKNKKQEQFSQGRVSTIQSVSEEQIQEEMKKWEEKLSAEQMVGNFEDKVSKMATSVLGLEAQFEICLNLSGKITKKQESLNQLLKGVRVFEISSKNNSKAHLRDFFYAPWIGSFCWKDPKELFPEKKQIVHLSDIREIRTGFDGDRKFPNGFKIEQYFKIVLIEKNQEIQFICEDSSHRNILVSVIHQLVEDIRKSRQLNAFEEIGIMDTYEKEVNKIKEQIEDSKSMFTKQIGLLRNAFLQAAQELVEREKKKTKRSLEKLQLLIEEMNKDSTRIEKKEFDNIVRENLSIKQECIELQSQVEDASDQIFTFKNREEEIQQISLEFERKLKLIKIGEISTLQKQPSERIRNCMDKIIQEFQKATIQLSRKYENSGDQKVFEEKNKQIVQLQSQIQSQNIQTKKLINEIKELSTSNNQLKHELETVISRMGQKETEFTHVVEDLHAMRDELLDKIEKLQAEVDTKQEESQDSNTTGEKNLVSLQNNSNKKEIKLEKKLIQKEEIIQELIRRLEEQGQSKDSLIENLKETGIQLVEENSSLKNELLNVKDENAQLVSRLSTFSESFNKNESHNIFKDQNDQLIRSNTHKCQDSGQLKTTDATAINSNQNKLSISKENIDPNLLNSQLSFKLSSDKRLFFSFFQDGMNFSQQQQNSMQNSNKDSQLHFNQPLEQRNTISNDMKQRNDLEEINQLKRHSSVREVKTLSKDGYCKPLEQFTLPSKTIKMRQFSEKIDFNNK